MAEPRGGRSLGHFVKGEVVVLNFPFSDLSQTKRRPALVIATLNGRSDEYSVPLEQSDFVLGGLNQSRRIRPNRLFTADVGIIVYSAGKVTEEKLSETINGVTAILRS